MEKIKILVSALVVIVLLIVVSTILLNPSTRKADEAHSDITSGITGIVLIGPQCPVVRVGDDSCYDKPYPANISIKSEDGSREIATFTSNSDGTFTYKIEPGIYLLDPLTEGGAILPRGGQQVVIVEQGRLTNVTITYDTGIR